MAHSSTQARELERLAGRGMYSLVMGIGAFFAYLSEMFGWARAPDATGEAASLFHGTTALAGAWLAAHGVRRAFPLAGPRA